MEAEETVRDYVTLIRGVTYKGALVGNPGPALLGLGSIHPGGGFREGDYKTYGGDCPPKLMLTPGDLFVSLKGATKDGKMIGSIARVPVSVPSGRLTQDTVKLEFRSDERARASSYLYWLLRTPQYREYCESRAMGSAVVALSRDDFLDFPVPNFSGARQAIIEVLERIEGKIELNRRMNAMLEAMARALFQSWFVDFDPVRAKMDGRQPNGLDPATAALFPEHLEESPIGNIPKGWKAGTVDEGFNLTMGQSPPGDTYNGEGNGLPFYQGRTDFGFRFPNRRIYCTTPTRYAKPGDTLVSVRAPVGDINMANEDCCIGRGVAAVRHKTGTPSFTYHSIANLYPDFARFEAEGTVFGSINKDSFEKLPLVIPPDEIVAAYERQAGPLDEQIQILEDQSRTLATLRDTLLPKLLSGELKVLSLL